MTPIRDVVDKIRRLEPKDRHSEISRQLTPSVNILHATGEGQATLNYRAQLMTALREAKVWPGKGEVSGE